MRILITGATGGIGSHIIKELQGKDYIITAHGRNDNALKKLAKKYGIKTLKADLSKEKGLNTLCNYAKKNNIDVLINNAGVLYMQDFANSDTKTIDNTIDVNITALIKTTHKILPLMLKRNSGRIVNIGSVVGSIGLPYFAVYCASKYAVKGFSESLHRELYDTNVNITYIAPRGVDTPMISNKERKVFKAMLSSYDSPEYVAKQIVKAIENNKTRLTIGLLEKLSCGINGAFPTITDMFFWLIRNLIKKEI
ncbi:MAG: SDR family NAD(P)-dependent oxidoreductase [Alphaproteobacteria bacterium]